MLFPQPLAGGEWLSLLAQFPSTETWGLLGVCSWRCSSWAPADGPTPCLVYHPISWHREGDGPYSLSDIPSHLLSRKPIRGEMCDSFWNDLKTAAPLIPLPERGVWSHWGSSTDRFSSMRSLARWKKESELPREQLRHPQWPMGIAQGISPLLSAGDEEGRCMLTHWLASLSCSGAWTRFNHLAAVLRLQPRRFTMSVIVMAAFFL